MSLDLKGERIPTQSEPLSINALIRKLRKDRHEKNARIKVSPYFMDQRLMGF